MATDLGSVEVIGGCVFHVRLALLTLALPVSARAQDACPEDPDKTEPGLCGCGVTDTDLSGNGSPDACIDEEAVLGEDVVLGLGGRVDAGAVVGDGTVVGRRAHVAADAVVGVDAMLGPQSGIGERTVLGDRTALGYGASVGSDVSMGDDVVLGSLVRVGDGGSLEARTVVARGAWLGDDVSVGEGAVLGPVVQVQDNAVVGSSTRLRRGAVVGRDATVSDRVRVGRDVVVGRGAVVGEDAVLRGDVVVGEWATVQPGVYLPRGAVVAPVNESPVIDSIEAPETLDLLSSTSIAVLATDPQVGQELFTSWTFLGERAGWTLSDTSSMTPILSVADGDSTPTVTLEVEVTDGSLFATSTHTIAHRNDPPVFDTITVPGSLEMNRSATLAATATDPQGQDVTLSWSLVGPSTGWSLSPEGVLSVGSFGSAQSATVRVTASDGYASATQDRIVSLISTIPSSCAQLRGTGAASGVYTIQPPGQSPFSAYCDMQTAGGGWTLISNRRAGSRNRESCGSRLMDFFQSGCGSPSSIGASQSYALNQSRRTSLPRSQVLVIQYLNGSPDTDDAYIMNVSTSADLFPYTASVQQIPIASVCTLSGSCDSSQVYWKYIGDYWFHNSSCASSSSGDSEYRGNYGLCHNGASTSGNREGDWTSSFTGNREQYDETKLWGYPSYSSHQYQERIFYR